MIQATDRPGLDGFSVNVVCMDLFITETTVCNRLASGPTSSSVQKLLIFSSNQTSSDSSPSQTNIIHLKKKCRYLATVPKTQQQTIWTQM